MSRRLAPVVIALLCVGTVLIGSDGVRDGSAVNDGSSPFGFSGMIGGPVGLLPSALPPGSQKPMQSSSPHAQPQGTGTPRATPSSAPIVAPAVLPPATPAPTLAIPTPTPTPATPNPTPAPTTPATPPIHNASALIPASGALFGAFVGPTAGVSTDQQEANITSLEGSIDRTLAVDMRYYKVTDTFPTELEQWDFDHGRIPMITWGSPPLHDVINGTDDAMFVQRADALKALGKPLFLRWGWEMNGTWYPWSGSQNGDDPSLFVAAWRHVHDIFVSEGADNVSWVWSPNAPSVNVPSAAWNAMANYYPGDAYVDWISVDGYNQGGTIWRSFKTIFNSWYTEWSTAAPSKPLMISETGSVETGGDKATWLGSVVSTLQTDFPRIRALIYFDSQAVGKPFDYHFDTSSAARAAFVALANDPHMGAA